MTLAAILVACVNAVIIGAVALELGRIRWRRRPRSWADAMTRRRVIVNLRSGESITGWVGDAWEDAVIVTSPEHIAPDGTRTPMDGRAVVPRAEVTFVQDVAE